MRAGPERIARRGRCKGVPAGGRSGRVMQDTSDQRQGGTTARICVLLNAGSGKGRAAGQGPDDIRAAFASAGLDADIRVLKDGSDIVPATRAALREGCDMIVAAGGDGTISGVAGVMNGSGVPLGILPLGTFNYFARSLDIPVEMPEAVNLLAQGVRRPVRVARINDRVFLNNASLGAYPAILRTREDIYRKWGRSRLAAYWSVLVTLVTLRRPLRLRIETGGKVIERRTPLAFAVNNAFQLDEVGLRGRDEIGKGRLALFIAPDTGRWGMLRHAVSLALRRAEQKVNFDLIAAGRMTIHAKSHSRDIACDGERIRMKAPFDLRVIEDALIVVVPRDRVADTR